MRQGNSKKVVPDTTVREGHFLSKNNFTKLHILYFVLAFVTLMTLGAFVYIFQNYSREYSEVVLQENKLMSLLLSLDECLDSAQKVNEVGNSIFESHNLSLEKSKFNKAIGEFDSRLGVFATSFFQVLSENEKVKRHSMLALAENHMKNMKNEELSVFEHIDKNNYVIAGAKMARMDDEYSKVITSFIAIRKYLTENQMLIITQHQDNVSKIKRLGYFLLNIVASIFLGTIFYSFKITNFMKKDKVKNEHLKNILTSIGDGIISLDQEGIISSWNPAAARIFELSANDVVGKPISVIDPNGEFENNQKSNETSLNYEVRKQTKSGKIITVLITSSQLQDEDGNFIGKIKTIHDITEQKIRENRLKIGVEQMAVLGQQLEDAQKIAKIGHWKLDIQNNELTWSSEHFNIFEINENISQIKLHELYKEKIHPEDLVKLDQVIFHAKNTGVEFSFDHRLLFNDGRVKHVQIMGRVVKDENNKNICINGTCQDLTERFQHEAEAQFLVNSLELGIWKYDPVAENLEWDKSMYKLYGIDPRDYRDASDAWESTFLPNAKLEAMKELKRALETENEFNSITEIETIKGEIRFVKNRAIIAHAKNGKMASVRGVSWDVTSETVTKRELLKNLEMQKLIQSIDLSIAASHDVENLIQNVISAITLNGNWAVANYWAIEDGEECLKLSKVHSLDTERYQHFIEVTKMVRFKIGEGLPGIVQETKSPTWISNIGTHSNFPRKPFALKNGIYGAMALPVMVHAKVLGVIEMFSENVLDPIESLNSDLLAIGMRIGQGIDKLNSEKQIENEQKRFEKLFHGINEGTIVTIIDIKGRFVFVNDKFIEISGFSREDLIGKDHRMMKSGIHSRDFFKHLWETILMGKVWQGEICNKKKDGSLYWTNTFIFSTKDANGETQFMSIRLDITEQVEIENKLRESNELVKFAIDGAGDGIWDWNIREDKMFFSKQWKEMLGYEENEIADEVSEWKKRIHPDELLEVETILENHLRGLGDYRIEYRMLCRDDSYRWFLSRGMVMDRDNNDNPLRMVGTHTDINKIKQAEQQLVQASKLASLGEMSAGVAHEINNPLTIIAGSTKLLSRYKDNPEKFASALKNIQKSSERISKIVNGLKKFSRSTVERDFQNHFLAKIVKEAIILTEVKVKWDEVKLIADIKTDAIIFCDEIEIEQVLINLINNAVDAIKDLPEKWIKVEVIEEMRMVLVRITDSGHGIPEDIRNKIFDPFFTTKGVGSGTGLGLSIVKGILEDHRALINIPQNTPNTSFEIRFEKIKLNRVA